MRGVCRFGMRGSLVCEKNVKNPKVKRLITSNVTFDLSAANQFNTDCFLAIAQQFQIPVITYSHCSLWQWTSASLGNPDNPSYIPILFAQSSNKISFFERFSSAFWYSLHHAHPPLQMKAPERRTAKQRFGESLPALSLLARNTTLMLVNNHFISNGPSPLVPGVTAVARINFKQTNKLP